MPDQTTTAPGDDPQAIAAAWVGRRETVTGHLVPELALMLAGALDHGAAPMPDTRAGAPMPPLWHWAAFPVVVPMAEVGADGHPRLGGFLPPLPFARRMWAGGRVTFAGPLSIDEPLERTTEIASVEFKSGSTGDMAFVKLVHQITGAGGGALREEQDLVYLAIPDSYRPPRPIPAPENPAFDEGLDAGALRLFRYSAATFNGHRIHYDRAYAQEAEKYPGLVVHGPMQASLLMDAAIRHTGQPPRAFRFRGVHPVLDGPLRLQGQPDGPGAMTLCTVAPEGHQGMQARFEWGAGA